MDSASSDIADRREVMIFFHMSMSPHRSVAAAIPKMLNFGKSRAKMTMGEKLSLSNFSDVAD